MGKMLFVAGPGAGPLFRVIPQTTRTYMPVQTAMPKHRGEPSPMWVEVPVQSYAFDQVLTIDPVDAYGAWQCPPGTEHTEKESRRMRMFQMDDVKIYERFWTKHEIEEFIGREIDGDVIVQRHEHHWLLWFASEDACSRFSTWFLSHTLGPRVELSVPRMLLSSMSDWLTEQGCEVRHQILINSRQGMSDQAMFVGTFRQEKDRLHFMLRWVGAES